MAASPKELARNKQVVKRLFDEVVNGRNLDVLDDIVMETALNT